MEEVGIMSYIPKKGDIVIEGDDQTYMIFTGRPGNLGEKALIVSVPNVRKSYSSNGDQDRDFDYYECKAITSFGLETIFLVPRLQSIEQISISFSIPAKEECDV